MVNIQKLKGKLIEKHFSVAKISKEMNMSPATFYRKLNENGDTFLIREVNQLVELLELDSNEAMTIFFTQFVA
jgi:AraC-like DNA-binding protein